MKKLFAVLLAVMMMASLLSFASADDFTIRIYSNSNSTERTTWLIEKAKEAGFNISIDDNSVISGDTAAVQAANFFGTFFSSTIFSDLTKFAGHSW